MFVSHSASAAGFGSFGRNKYEISIPITHPCASVLQMELSQIEIMEATKVIIDRDSTLRTAGNTAGAADAGQDAVEAAISGDIVSATINAVSALIYGKRAIEEGKEGIGSHFTLAESINLRKKNLTYVLANPQVCNEAVRKVYLTGYIADNKANNDKYILVLDAAINKIEGTISPILNAVALGAGSFLGLSIGTFGYGKDYFYSIPTVNDLKAQKIEAEKISAQLQGQLAQLRAAK